MAALGGGRAGVGGGMPPRSRLRRGGVKKGLTQITQSEARRYIKAELKRADVTYAELAARLREHGLTDETEGSVTAKLARGTFSVTWFLAVLAVLGITALVLADL